MTISPSVLELIGGTPMVQTQRLDTGRCALFLKLESANPGGSIKDRIGLSMIEGAERAGKIRPGATLVEGTAGNTGLGLALVAQQKGYRLILVVPDKMSREKIFNLKAMGAEVVLTRSDVAKGHPEYYQDLAERIAAETPGAYFINQFGNPDNPRAHEGTTGPEIFEQMDGRVDAIVIGAGSGGTFTGVARHLSTLIPHLECYSVESEGSALGGGTPYPHRMEGIGSTFVPKNFDASMCRELLVAHDEDAFGMARRLASEEGVLAGGSGGANVWAAVEIAKRLGAGKRVVTVVPDSSERYLSKGIFES